MAKKICAYSATMTQDEAIAGADIMPGMMCEMNADHELIPATKANPMPLYVALEPYAPIDPKKYANEQPNQKGDTTRYIIPSRGDLVNFYVSAGSTIATGGVVGDGAGGVKNGPNGVGGLYHQTPVEGGAEGSLALVEIY